MNGFAHSSEESEEEGEEEDQEGSPFLTRAGRSRPFRPQAQPASGRLRGRAPVSYAEDSDSSPTPIRPGPAQRRAVAPAATAAAAATEQQSKNAEGGEDEEGEEDQEDPPRLTRADRSRPFRPQAQPASGRLRVREPVSYAEDSDSSPTPIRPGPDQRGAVVAAATAAAATEEQPEEAEGGKDEEEEEEDDGSSSGSTSYSPSFSEEGWEEEEEMTDEDDDEDSEDPFPEPSSAKRLRARAAGLNYAVNEDEEVATPASARRRRPFRGTSKYEDDSDWEMGSETKRREPHGQRRTGRGRRAAAHTWQQASIDDDDEDHEKPRKRSRPSPKKTAKRRRPSRDSDGEEVTGTSRRSAKRRRQPAVNVVSEAEDGTAPVLARSLRLRQIESDDSDKPPPSPRSSDSWPRRSSPDGVCVNIHTGSAEIRVTLLQPSTVRRPRQPGT